MKLTLDPAAYRGRLRLMLEHLTFRCDTTNFLIDKPRLYYQPLPWIGIVEGQQRDKGTVQRWHMIRAAIDTAPGSSALDIGCGVGYFSLSLAEAGYIVFGVERPSRLTRIAMYATPSSLKERCHILQMTVDERTVRVLPEVDDVLCLSVWHHWVRYYGMDSATAILKSLWNKTRMRLFFESGEGEIASEFNLPFDNENARSWLLEYLQSVCGGGRVIPLGESEVGHFYYYEPGRGRMLYMVSRLPAQP
jgi:SAM-dependent methyltransferase